MTPLDYSGHPWMDVLIRIESPKNDNYYVQLLRMQVSKWSCTKQRLVAVFVHSWT